MPPKKKTPAPIDRPLSKAYLRNFTGWSTAYPPGHSDPTSLRVMENMLVDRNGALLVRPGMRYLTYTTPPDSDPLIDNALGIAIDRPMIGMQEPFYVAGGAKALLFAVREADLTVGWRAILFTGTSTVVHKLTDPEIGFEIPQGEAVLNFPAWTTHVEYLQIDNKIIAMNDAGDPIRIFFVGNVMLAKALSSITVPHWDDGHKLFTGHPDANWILQQGYTSRRNQVYNPSFEAGSVYWVPAALTEATVSTGSAVAGTHRMGLKTRPTRTNMQTSPLHNVASTGTAGWYPHQDYGKPKLTVDGTFMKVYEASEKGTFLAYGAKLSYGVVAGKKYQVALDYELGSHVEPITVLTFYNSAGAKIGNSTSLEMPKKAGHYISGGVLAPTGTVTMRVSVGGRNETTGSTYVKVKNVMLCREEEVTTFFHGGSGVDFFWMGAANASASVHHPATYVELATTKVPIHGGSAWGAAIHVASHTARGYTLFARSYNKDGVKVGEYTGAGTIVPDTAWARVQAGTATSPADAVKADIAIQFYGVKRGEIMYVDAAIIEDGVAVPGVYFDGSTPADTLSHSHWADPAKPHTTFSVQYLMTDAAVYPYAETPTAKTLIAIGGAAANPFKVGFFYTFENEVGESAPSKIVEVRMSRAWANWLWETPNEFGEPSGVATDVAELCADQLIAAVPMAVYAQAVAEGAIKWNLYAMTWNDQQTVPVDAQLVAEIKMYADDSATHRAPALTYDQAGWATLTPARKISQDLVQLPTRENRVNYSDPPHSRNGLVAGDRLILVGDPRQMATIRWASNAPGNYTNFTASRGGGEKTLTSGNLNLPASVVLWQNPQSVDTITILCLSGDGSSVSYYMQPMSVNAQSGSAPGMGFEETTSTPGTTSPWGVEVLNNALFRPTDKALLKSTASNYNISHKHLTDNIANMWWSLRDKIWIMSAQLNNRLCYLVHNPYGARLEDNCKGNELWVYDITAETGFWSRFLIQGQALRVFTLAGRDYLGVTRPDGLYYLDPEARMDDYVVLNATDPDFLKVKQRPISWRCETNTQGANRAHDAWAHLQQVQLTIGNFSGALRWGIRSHDVNGKDIEVAKEIFDPRPAEPESLRWDHDDFLQVRRDLKEWVFFAHSVEGKPSSGQIGYVQYRYTPVSVNVGYEYGSVETFEYQADTLYGVSQYSAVGIPWPVMDYTRP